MFAFSLTDQAKAEGFVGGSFKAGPQGHMFDVAEALGKGNGVIVTEDLGMVELLRAYPALQEYEGDVPSGIEPVKTPGMDEVRTEAPPWIPQQPQDAGVVAVGEVPAQHGEETGEAGPESPADKSPAGQVSSSSREAASQRTAATSGSSTPEPSKSPGEQSSN